MSIAKGLIVKPRSCPFCGGQELELRAVIFRHWKVHCLNTDCLCRGPDGKTPDIAVAEWNTLTENCINERQDMSQVTKEYQNPKVPQKIWKAARALRSFTINDVIRITECSSKIVRKYLSLLEANEYLRIEQHNNSTGVPTSYRCIQPRVVTAPPWLSLQLSPREYQEYREGRKSMKWTKIQAVTD